MLTDSVYTFTMMTYVLTVILVSAYMMDARESMILVLGDHRGHGKPYVS